LPADLQLIPHAVSKERTMAKSDEPLKSAQADVPNQPDAATGQRLGRPRSSSLSNETADEGEDDPSPTVRVTVHPRRTVQHQVVAGSRVENGKKVPVYRNRTANGGEIIEVPVEEAAFLRAHGFLQDPAGEVVEMPPALGTEPNPTINGEDGSIVRAGR
jgi:hypothetical protein